MIWLRTRKVLDSSGVALYICATFYRERTRSTETNVDLGFFRGHGFLEGWRDWE
jgi:hypothetical protein